MNRITRGPVNPHSQAQCRSARYDQAHTQGEQLRTPTKEASKPIVIRDGYYHSFELSSYCDLSYITFSNCIFSSLNVQRDQNKIKGPFFKSCIIENVIGALSRDDLPQDLIDETSDIESFRWETETNTEIRAQNLPSSVKVLLTCLNKLFMRGGNSRNETASFRGIDDVERAYVDDILQLISTHNFAQKQRMGGPFIWIANRSKRREAVEILQAPQELEHPLLVAVRAL